MPHRAHRVHLLHTVGKPILHESHPIIDDNVFDGARREDFSPRSHSTNHGVILDGSPTVTTCIIDNDGLAPGQNHVSDSTYTQGEIQLDESWINGNPVRGRPEHEHDQDWYQTTLTKGNCCQIDVWGKTVAEEGFAENLTLEDPSLEGVYRSDGKHLCDTSDDGGRGDGRWPRHTLRFNKTGTLYISVPHDWNNYAGGGAFELSLIDLGKATPGLHQPRVQVHQCHFPVAVRGDETSAFPMTLHGCIRISRQAGVRLRLAPGRVGLRHRATRARKTAPEVNGTAG